MALLGRITGGLRALFSRQNAERELDEELRGYLDAAFEQKVAAGMGREEALRAVRLEMGNPEVIKESVRDAGWESFAHTLAQDARFALRIFRKNPGFTAVAVLTLALGVGANTAIFSLIDTLMLRLLPVENPEQLVHVTRRGARDRNFATIFTNPLWEQVRDRQDVFSGVFAWGGGRFDLAQGGAVHYVDGIFVSGAYFSTLGVQAAAGRLFGPGDDHRGCAPVAVLSHAFWQEHFGGAASAIGSTISLDKHPFQIIGVSGPGFYGVYVGQKFEVAVPICISGLFDGERSRLDQRSWWWLNIIGRLRPDLTPDQLKARLAAVSAQVLAAALPQNWHAQEQKDFLQQVLEMSPAATGSSYMRELYAEPLTILMGVVGLVLLIACANVATLMLARATARGKEIAVRKALGASRRRLVRQLLTESVLLSAAGAGLGILFAHWGSALLVRFISTGRTPVFLNLLLNLRVLGFTAAVALLTGILFGVLPALRSTRVSLMAAMKGSQTVEHEHGHRFRAGKWAVGLQVALSLVLLVAAGLLLRSFAKLTLLDLGFDRNNVLIARANLQVAEVPRGQRNAAYEEIERRLRALPGVMSVGRSIMTPMSGFTWNNSLHVDSPGAPQGEQALAYFNFISPEYFQTLRTPLLAGRNFNDRDTGTSPKVAILGETTARRFFPNTNPLGKSFRVDALPGEPTPLVQVVGVVKDSKYQKVDEETLPTAFFPISQITEDEGAEESYELRAATRPSALISAVQNAVAGVNRAIPLEFFTLEEQVADSLVLARLLATLSAFFGGLALLLAAVGLYGALSYLVTQRQPEFGIRLALGAPRATILRLVMRDAAVILAGGVAAGIALSLATTTLLRSMLFALAPRDTLTIASVTLVLIAVALLAAFIPARRAMRADPMAALRYE